MNLHSKFYLKRADARNTGHRRLCRRVPHPRTQFAVKYAVCPANRTHRRQPPVGGEPFAGDSVHANP